MVLGVFKRLKNMSLGLSNLLDTANQLYKHMKPAVQSAMNFIPYGNVISQGLDMASGMWDQGRQIAQNVRQNRMIGTG